MRTLWLGGASLASVMLLMSGCAVSRSGSEVDDALLPTGLTLLESERAECRGVIEIDDGSIRGRSSSGLVVRQGQNAVFEIGDDEEVEWTCIGQSSSERDTVDCPRATSHVRITRGATGDGFVVECYGRD
jgi:hypothetical protein